MNPAHREELEHWYRAGLAAVDPAAATERQVQRAPNSLRIAGVEIPADAGIAVLAVGKAAGAMAGALEAAVGDRVADALVVTTDGAPPGPARWRLETAGHPLPDARSEAAGRAALRLARSVSPENVLVVLLSGGASALLTTPEEGLSQSELTDTTDRLLRGGAPIAALNAVRKHAAAVGGGKLVSNARCRATVQLTVSDVRGDPLDVIGSGPCAPDPTFFADALDALERFAGIDHTCASVVEYLRSGKAGERHETPKPGDPVFDRVTSVIIARNRDALEAIQREATGAGLVAVVVSDRVEGEASEVGSRMGALLRASRERGLWIAGGETTVTVRGDGRGGRNQELALAAALELDGAPAATLLAAGTDGIDGPTDAAGAFSDGETVARGRDCGVDARAALERNDAYGFFDREGGLLRTGPTGTNVMDVVLGRFGS